MNIRYLSKLADKSFAQIAEEIGISRSTFQMYVNGRAAPKIGNLKLIADFFKVTEEQLLHVDLTKLDAKSNIKSNSTVELEIIASQQETIDRLTRMLEKSLDP